MKTTPDTLQNVNTSQKSDLPLTKEIKDRANSAMETKNTSNNEEYSLESNTEFLWFKKIEVTKVDESKPWKPALEVKVILENGTIIENVDANTPFFIFRDLEWNEMTVSAVAAWHIDSLHIKGEDAGSKFDYSTLEELFKDVAKKIPKAVAIKPGISDFAIDMNRQMGKEGIASMQELLSLNIIDEQDIIKAESARKEVWELNKTGDNLSKNEFIEKYKIKNPDCKIQFQLIRGTVLVPVVNAPKHSTTELFMVFWPDARGRKTVYTMAPWRHMPRHPDPNQHKDQQGILNEETFWESVKAWFDTVMLIWG